MTQRHPPGTRCEVRLPGKVPITGTVLTAYNYGTEEEPNWYVELNRDGVPDALFPIEPGYGYYKQRDDGGTVVFFTQPQV